MSSFDNFLRERRIIDTYDSFSKEEKLEWNKIFQEEKSRASTAGKSPSNLISLQQ
jgi:hypothetical protein